MVCGVCPKEARLYFSQEILEEGKSGVIVESAQERRKRPTAAIILLCDSHQAGNIHSMTLNSYHRSQGKENDRLSFYYF